MAGEYQGDGDGADGVGGAGGGAHGGVLAVGGARVADRDGNPSHTSLQGAGSAMEVGHPTIRLGIIGAGIMGERLLRAALDHAGDAVHVAGIWDANGAALDRLGAAVPERKPAESAEAVIRVRTASMLRRPRGRIWAMRRRRWRRGGRCSLEKPLAADVGDSRRFVAAADGARAAVDFPFASSLAVAALAGWLEAGATGAARGCSIKVGFGAWPRPWQRAAAAWLDGRGGRGLHAGGGVALPVAVPAAAGAAAIAVDYATYPAEGAGSERLVQARLYPGGLPGGQEGAVGATPADDSNTWDRADRGVRRDIRLRDWSFAERQRPDGSWAADPDAVPNERLRPLVLHRQLQEVARMTRGEAHRLATVTEAFEVQEVVEAILTATALPGVTRRA